MVGAQLAVSLPGTALTPGLVEHLRAIQANSLVLFSRNYVSPAQCLELIRSLEAALGRPLVVMVDHEGGRVVRFPTGVTSFPDARAQGQRHDLAAIRRQGEIEGEELRPLGVRVNLAPCADVVVEGADPVIGARSYGADPAWVAACAAARIEGLQSRGVAACAKHFPGLGAVPRDPHLTLPTIRLDRATLERIHLAPFQAAAAAGVAMIMSSHVCYPTLGDPPGVPATFSARLIRGVLRDRMQFEGVVLSDDLEMGALRECGTIGDAAVKAVAAGHDVVLFCSGDMVVQQEAFAALQGAYQCGRLDLSRLEATVERIRLFEENFCNIY